MSKVLKDPREHEDSEERVDQEDQVESLDKLDLMDNLDPMDSLDLLAQLDLEEKLVGLYWVLIPKDKIIDFFCCSIIEQWIVQCKDTIQVPKGGSNLM